MKQQAEAVIASLRADLDALDATLVTLLSRRVAMVLAVNLAKRVAGRPVHDPEREEAIINLRASYAPADVVEIYKGIVHALSLIHI